MLPPSRIWRQPLKSLAAARARDTGHWRRRGARSPAHDLAQRTGTTIGAAAEALEAGRRLGELPVLAGAAKRGEVSPQQVAAIADAASADASAERRLVESSKHSSLAELRNECARTRAAARPHDAEPRHREVHRTRCLRTFTDREGGWNLWVRNVPEVGAELMATLRPLQDRVFRRSRTEGRRDSFESYGADALADMVRLAASASSCKAPGRDGDRPQRAGAAGRGTAVIGTAAAGGSADAGSADAGSADAGSADGAIVDAGTAGSVPSVLPSKIIVRVDWDALVRGSPTGGELCEIAGVGAVPVSVVRAMFATGDPFLAVVVTKGADVVNVAHLGRRATAQQMSALEWRDPVCPVEGCDASAYLEIDHREDWAKTRITLLTLLAGHAGSTTG